MSLFHSLCTSLVLISHLPFTVADTFNYAAIGDSWAAGAGVKAKERFDNNNEQCYRWANAWEAQVANDSSWTNDPIDFKFPACSGSKLVGAVKGDPELPAYKTPQ